MTTQESGVRLPSKKPATSTPSNRTIFIKRYAPIAAFGIVALLVGLFIGVQWQASIILALLACMGALALNLLMGTAGQVSIGTAGLLAVGAYSSVWLTSLHVPFPLDVVGAALITGIVGLIIGIPALRLRGLYLAIATLAAHFIILFAALQYQNAAAGPAGFILDQVIPGDLDTSQTIWLVIVVVLVVITYLVIRALSTGRTGRTWRMIRDHENVASTFGINVTRWKLTAFVISSVIIGVQGGLFAHFSGGVSTDSFSLGVAITYIAMVIIGGLDTLAGPIVGAILISILPTVIPSLLAPLTGQGGSASVGANISTIIYGALVLAFVVFIPKGIVGSLRPVFLRLWRRARRTGDN